MRTRTAFAAALLFSAACGEQPSAPIPPDADLGRERAGPGAVSAVTWNVYVGADIEALLVESPLPLPVRVARIFAEVQATSFPDRAAAIAGEIAAIRPHLIGLNEISLYRLQSPGDILLGNLTPNAGTTVLDFLAILRSALAARGLDYVVAAVSENWDFEFPVLNAQGRCDAASPCDDIRLTDYDAILARSDVAISDAANGNYAVSLQLSAEGLPLTVTRGWAAVDATVKGITYRFVTAHPEPADIGPDHAVIPEVEQIQLAQIGELLQILAGEERVILSGDLNTDPDGSTTATYGALREAGFIDAWLVGPPRGLGYTANQEPDLLSPDSDLFHRIDFILYRDDATVRTGKFRGSVHAEVIGEEQADRTASALWPSDHAGVAAILRPSPGLGER